MRALVLVSAISLSTALVGVSPASSGQDDHRRARGASGSLVTSEGITVEQAAARIAATRGRPSIVLLYGTRCALSEAVFPEVVALTRRHPDVTILAFATDEELADEVEPFLTRHAANFAAVYIRDWPAGALTKAMEPLGIRIGTTWTRPLIAVRNGEGRVVAQAEGVTNVVPVERILAQLR